MKQFHVIILIGAVAFLSAFVTSYLMERPSFGSYVSGPVFSTAVSESKTVTSGPTLVLSRDGSRRHVDITNTTHTSTYAPNLVGVWCSFEDFSVSSVGFLISPTSTFITNRYVIDIAGSTNPWAGEVYCNAQYAYTQTGTSILTISRY